MNHILAPIIPKAIANLHIPWVNLGIRLIRIERKGWRNANRIPPAIDACKIESIFVDSSPLFDFTARGLWVDSRVKSMSVLS